MSGLTEFLLARIAEDEERARKRMARAQQNHLTVRAPENLGRFMPGWWEWPEIEADAARVLARCEADRRIVEGADVGPSLYGPWGGIGDDDGWTAIEWALKVLALPYADHPDYREEWKP